MGRKAGGKERTENILEAKSCMYTASPGPEFCLYSVPSDRTSEKAKPAQKKSKMCMYLPCMVKADESLVCRGEGFRARDAANQKGYLTYRAP